jgi:O-antigen/teichoic acid export membrane protein
VNESLMRLRRFASGIRFSNHSTSTAEGRSKERYRRAVLTSLASGFSRAISIVTGLVSVPLTLHYLGTERYGLWMTLSAVIAALGFADLGISNGLTNGIAKAYGRDDRLLAKKYVSSAFFFLVAIALILGSVFAVAYPWIHWNSIFRVRSEQAISEIGPALVAFAICFILNIPSGIASRVQSGYQEGFIANLWVSLGNILCLLALLVVIHIHGSLALLVLAMAGPPILALLLNGAVEFGIQRPWLLPSWRYLDSGVSRSLLRLGSLFFILQLGGAIAFSSDNIVLARILGPEAVSQYAVPSKLFALLTVATSFLVAPLWPAYGEALERRDHRWIRTTLYSSVKLVTGVSVAFSVPLVLFGGAIIRLWVGPEIHPSLLLLVSLAIWGALSAVSSAVSMFLNGLSIIRFQVIISFLGALTNIILSVFLTQRIGMLGVVYGSILSQIFVGLVPYYFYVSHYFRNALSDPALTDSDH